MHKTLKNKRFKRALCIKVLYIDDVRKNAPNLKIERQKTNGRQASANGTTKATNLLAWYVISINLLSVYVYMML